MLRHSQIVFFFVDFFFNNFHSSHSHEFAGTVILFAKKLEDLFRKTLSAVTGFRSKCKTLQAASATGS